MTVTGNVSKNIYFQKWKIWTCMICGFSKMERQRTPQERQMLKTVFPNWLVSRSVGTSIPLFDPFIFLPFWIFKGKFFCYWTPWLELTEIEDNYKNSHRNSWYFKKSHGNCRPKNAFVPEQYWWTFEGYYIQIKTPKLHVLFAIKQPFPSFLVLAWLIFESVKWLKPHPVL